MAVRNPIPLAASLALLVGCSATGPHTIHVPAAQFRSVVVRPGDHAARKQRSTTALVEESLHARGIRFGTDGSPVALFAFISRQFPTIPAVQAQPGDVLFFDLGSGCGSHAGVVETTDGTGRIGFREWRDGSTRHSYVAPPTPLLRRDDKGRILNTFLRPKRPEDALDTRYFAGDMLCAAFRIEGF